MIRIERLTDLFLRLASISSPTGGEREMADILTQELIALGFLVEEDNTNIEENGAGNLFAQLPGHGDPILFCCHMDTVEPCRDKQIIIENGVIRSAGETILGSDDLAGIVEILEAVSSLAEDNADHRPLEILFTHGEELFLRGARSFDFSKITARECFVPDVDGTIGTAILRAPTGMQILVDINGVSAHAGLRPEDGVNAICIASKAISSLDWGRIDSETTSNVGVIRGGVQGNIVPDDCFVEIELRSLSHKKAAELAVKIRDNFQSAAKELGGTVNITINQPLTAYTIDEDAPISLRFAKACRLHGIEPRFTSSCGGSDNAIINLNGIRGIVIAPGMHDIHSVNEWTTVEELYQMSSIIEELMKN